MSELNFFYEDITFCIDSPESLKQLLFSVIKHENDIVEIGDINFIFVSDAYLLDINRTYLNRAYYTDTITFNYSSDQYLAGDIFISIDRVAENAVYYGVFFYDELRRVLVHSILHIFDYDDYTSIEKHFMQAKEDYYLSLYFGS